MSQSKKQSVIDILDELEETPGKLAKMEILHANEDNNLLRQVFIAAQDPYTVYHVNKFKAPRPVKNGSDDDTSIVAFCGLLDKLSAQELTGNAAKDAVTEFFSELDERQQKWCERIILRNLRVGCQERSVNKVWPGSMKSFAVALAETLKTLHSKETGIKIEESVKYPVRVEPKLDGLRCIAMKQNGIVTMCTRNGTVLETLPTIKRALEDAPYDNVVLDGEMLADSNDWNTSVSVVMAHKTMKNDEHMVYHVFDAVLVSDWIEQECNEPYEHRLARIDEVLINVKTMHVTHVPGETVRSEADLLKFYSNSMNAGHEGIMIKDLQAPYHFKRSDALLKMKPIMTHELIVVGHYEGRRGTKREGLFGGFRAIASNGVVTRIGGGFSDALKAEIQLQGPDNFVGRICECECQPDPTTQDGLTIDGKLRFPVWCRWRSESDVDPKLVKVGCNAIQSGQYDDEDT